MFNMNQLLKKITILGLMIVVAIPLSFTAGIIVKQKVLQFHRRERLEKETLQTITVPAEKIKWIKAGKEILVDGKLFDVKHYSKDGHQIILTGFFDKEEDSLYDQINQIAQENNRSSPFKVIINFLLTPIYNDMPSISLQPGWQSHTQQYFSFTERIPSRPPGEISHPPGAYTFIF